MLCFYALWQHNVHVCSALYQLPRHHRLQGLQCAICNSGGRLLHKGPRQKAEDWQVKDHRGFYDYSVRLFLPVLRPRHQRSVIDRIILGNIVPYRFNFIRWLLPRFPSQDKIPKQRPRPTRNDDQNPSFHLHHVFWHFAGDLVGNFLRCVHRWAPRVSCKSSRPNYLFFCGSDIRLPDDKTVQTTRSSFHRDHS